MSTLESKARVQDGSKFKTDREYQYLQNSCVPTDVFQSSLPRLPIPTLEKTCDRYLASQKPLLSSKEFSATEKYVRAFLQNDGPQWQKQLIAKDKANKQTSYISGPWSDMYLKDRRPVAFTHNPGLALADDPRSEFARDTSMRAANMLVSSLRFLKSMQKGQLYPDVFHMQPSKTNNDTFWRKVKWMPSLIATPLSYAFKVFPLDMSQFPNLLQSTRIPAPERDIIRRFPDSKHIVIIHKGCFFAFDALDEDGDLFSPDHYLGQIKSILQRPSYQSTGIGSLTATDRDSWTQARQRLIDLGNKDALEKIDSAIITICIDDWNYNPEQQEKVVMELCCGSNPDNRWFDKSVSMIFSANGLAGLNFEHAWGDGVAVMRFFDDILNDNFSTAYVSNDASMPSSCQAHGVQEIQFNLDDDLKSRIDKARRSHLEKLSTLDFKAMRRDGFGKNACKKVKVGPDALMQLAFQIANLKVNGSFAPTYESCSTAIYRHGRTETVRPLTAEMHKCAVAFDQKRGKDKLVSLMQQCSKAHMEMTKNAAQGQGWDRHFFALRNLMAESNASLPDIFRDSSFQKINHIILSTSTLSSTNFGVGGFCPVTPDGYGLGYQIRGNDLGVCASVFKQEKNVNEIIDALEETFNAMSQVLT